jgi:uncharacterized membrane protein (DUF4010 family)
MDWTVVTQLSLATGLGLLVGLQRERTAPHVAGIRSFALITLIGCLLGLLSDVGGAWILAAGLLAIAAVTVVGNYVKILHEKGDRGITTQLAVLVMFGTGAAVGLERFELGIISAGVTAVLLYWKQPLHGFVKRTGDSNFRSIMQLVLIGMVILPVLPNRSFGQYKVINPFEIWLMVVLIVGISVIGSSCTGSLVRAGERWSVAFWED